MPDTMEAKRIDGTLMADILASVGQDGRLLARIALAAYTAARQSGWPSAGSGSGPEAGPADGSREEA